MGGTRDHLRQVIERGRCEDGVSPDTPIALFSDPWDAAAFAASRFVMSPPAACLCVRVIFHVPPTLIKHAPACFVGCGVACRDPLERLEGGGNIHAVIQCRVAPGETLVIPGGGRGCITKATVKKAANRIPSGYTAAALSAVGGNDSDDGDSDDTEQPPCYVLRTSAGARVLPEFYILAVEVGPDDVVRKLGAVSNAARGIDSNEAALDAALADLVKPLAVRDLA